MWLVFGHGPNSIALQHLLSGLRFFRSFSLQNEAGRETCENGSHENARRSLEGTWAAGGGGGGGCAARIRS